MAIDFFDPSHKDVTDPTQRGLSRLAKDELDPDRPTVGYFFTNEEIHDLASECDLSVEDIIQAPKWNWRIVRFRKA
jgi:hypothetical protein